MFRRKILLAVAFFSVPSIINLIYYAYLGSFSRFIADDFCSISTIQRLGFLHSIRFWYFNWNGRYANSFVDGLLKILGGDHISYVVPFVLLIWLLVTIYAVAWTLPAQLNRIDKSRQAIPIGALAIFSTLLLSPNVPQSLYWWGGLRAYTFPLILISLYVLFYQFFYQREQAFHHLSPGVYLVSFMLTFFIAGFSETLLPALVIFIAGLAILELGSKRISMHSSTFNFLIAGLAGALVGLIVLVIAPGNAVRQEVFHRSTILAAFPIAFNSYWTFLRNWLGELKSILGLCLLGACGIWAGMQIKPLGKYHLQYSLIFLLFGAILAYCCFLPAAYSMSTLPPERALINPIYFLINSILAGSYFLGQKLQVRFVNLSNINMQVGIGAVLFVLITATSVLNVSLLYSTRIDYIQYAQQWDEMDAYIHTEKDKGKEKVRILAKQNWAGLDEPNNRPGFWLNKCMSDYYGIQVLGPAPDHP